jgi:type II secretory pathway component GspD/PulD (secretin)
VSPEDVVDLIQSSVSPDTWDDEAYSIVIRGTSLFVTAPRQVHVLLNEFLTSQAHAKNILVHIDAKWLEINDGYLEEIGVDWGASASILQTPNGGFQPGFQSGTQTSSFIGNVRNRLPTALVSPQPLTAGSGLSLNVMRLGGAQVAAVLAAIERKNQARILDAPSIATLNGVRGSCFFGTQIAFISDYEVVSENLDPTISVLNIGANLDIKPFVSADRKHVVMEFRPALASARFFVELINAPRILPTGPTVPGGPLPPPPVITAYPIELPNVAIKEVATTIDVPDRGTILVGGFGRHIEETASAKVPFLGHIPYLGRLFGRRGRYSDRSKLYLLATVNIITYQEAEARL